MLLKGQSPTLFADQAVNISVLICGGPVQDCEHKATHNDTTNPGHNWWLVLLFLNGLLILYKHKIRND